MGGVHPEVSGKSKKEKLAHNHDIAVNHEPPVPMPRLTLAPQREVQREKEIEKDVEHSDPGKNTNSNASILSPRSLLSPRSKKEKKDKEKSSHGKEEKREKERRTGSPERSHGDEREERRLHFYLIGDPGVGKSSLINRFINGEWNPATITTWANTSDPQTFTKTITVGNEEITIFITDTGGTEHLCSVTDSSLRDQDGIMIVYDVKNPSVASLEHWLARGHRFGKKNGMRLLVANKGDLDKSAMVEDIDIDTSNYHNMIIYPRPVSALTGLGVDNAFHALAMLLTDENFDLT